MQNAISHPMTLYPRRFCFSLLALSLVALSPLASPSAFGQLQPGQTLTAHVDEVKSGDTFVLKRWSGAILTVRLYGMDAPEPDQPYGTSAAKRARDFLGDKSVEVKVKKIGAEGRVIGRIRVEGDDLGAELLRDGCGWYATPDVQKYARLERKARNAERGLWEQESPTPPWRWRNQSDGQGHTTASS
jgi:endonuclease YncB( thermonuclease family)